MGIATKIPQNTFEGLQVDAGVLLTTFDPTDPEITDAAIILYKTFFCFLFMLIPLIGRFRNHPLLSCSS